MNRVSIAVLVLTVASVVGIQLAPRRSVSESLDSAKEHKAQREFLKQRLG